MRLSAALTIALVALAAHAAESQQVRDRSKNDDIPVRERPPAGMCRIWLDGVPAAQQPAPTDCATAVRNRPAKGRVIFGDDYVDRNKKADSSKSKSPIKGFAPPSKGRKPD